MKVGIVFHKDPVAPASGIDLVRLRAIACGLFHRGVDVEIIAPVEKESRIDKSIPVHPLSALSGPPRYDIVKTCYHFSISLINDYAGPVVSRIVRVVDNVLPERDASHRDRLLECQDRIFRRASALVLNNIENQERWYRLYGDSPPIALIPTGAASVIPPVHCNPFGSDERVVLFLGSIAAPRMVRLLNETASRLRNRCSVHVVGTNKAGLYGGGNDCRLDPVIVNHGPLPEDKTWDFIRHASIGLALATGPHAFDNDLSKIYNYLRGGLPVLSEEPVISNELIRQTGMGMICRHGDIDDLVSKANELLDRPPLTKRESTMEWMASVHSWDNRVDSLLNLLREVADSRPGGG